VVSGAATVATVSQPTMTFTPQNWNSVQTLTINGVQDANTTDGSTMLTFSSPDAPTVMLPVTVTDDDVLALALSSTTLSLGEGGTTTFTVALTQDPGASKAVTLTTANAAIGTVTPTTMTFTGGASGNWGAPQLVTVSAPADDDTANASTSITLAATGLSDRVVSIAVTDDDVQAITTTPNPPMTVAVTEGATGTLAVRLAFKPAADVTISASSLAPGVATVTPATLTFSTTNWAMPQNATVTALQDADAAAGSTTIRLETAALGLTRDVGVTVTDDDTLALALSSTTTTVTEGLTTTFTVALTAQPLASTTISIATSNAAAATATSTVTFSTTDWATPKTVTVTGVQDTNLASDTATLTLSASGGATIAPATVAVTVTDDDTQAIVASSATVGVTEGSTAQFTVRLAFQPAANVTVNVASGNTAIATVNAATLSFTTATWNTPQTVTVTAPQDADTMGNTTMVALTSGALTTNVTINVTDDDALNIALSPSTLHVTEGGTATLNVSLTAQPASNLTVTLASSDATAVTLGTTSLTFTTTNWATAQPVTVTGVEDADAAQEAVTITATSGALTRTATATTIENDALTVVTSTGALTLTEGGTGTFTVRLGAQPAAAVSVAVQSSDTGIATISPATLTFDAATWNTPQTVTVGGTEDQNLAANVATISLTSAGAGNASVTATVNDNDTQAIQVSATTVSVIEGQSTTFTARLAYQPAATGTVNVSPATTPVTVAPASLSFTTTPWNQPQTLTVSRAQDPNATPDTATVSLTGGGAPAASVTVNVQDDDTLGIELEATTLTVNEGSTGILRVRLTAAPAAQVFVNVTSTNTAKLTVTPLTVSFDGTNWNTYKSITAVGVQDADPDTENVSVSFSSPTPGITTRTANVQVRDDEVQGILLDTTSMRIGNGTNRSIGVRLQSPPSGTVVVNIASDNPQIASVTTTSVSFTSSDWSGYQFVPIRGEIDPDYDVETTTVRFTTPGVPQNAVTVTVAEQDIMYSSGPNPSTICEGDAMYMEIALNGDPGGPLAVNVDPPYFMFASTQQVLFDSTNWTSPQGVWLYTNGTGDGVVYLSTDDSLSYLQFNVWVTRNWGGFECLARR